MYILFDSGLAKDNGVELSCRVCGYDFAIDFLYLDHGDIVRCPNCISCAITRTGSGLFDPEELLTKRFAPKARPSVKVF